MERASFRKPAVTAGGKKGQTPTKGGKKTPRGSESKKERKGGRVSSSRKRRNTKVSVAPTTLADLEIAK